NLIDTLLQQKDAVAAVRAVREMAADLPDDPAALASAAQSLAHCATLIPADARGLADESFALLQRAAKHGYEDWESLVSAKAWRALRGRPDFQKLTADLGESVRLRAIAEVERRASQQPENADTQHELANALDDLGLWYRFLRREAEGV